MLSSPLAIAGAGIGLRAPHAIEILDQGIGIPWLEVLADNWLMLGGINRDIILQLGERYPTVLHGVGLSIGSITPLDFDYLAEIKQLKNDIGASWYSEHCSFSHDGNYYVPDLLPLPYTEEAIKHVSHKVRQVQDFMGERMVLENVSTYISSADNMMHEADFLAAIVSESDCDLLLDLNNLQVSCFNLSSENFDNAIDKYLSALPMSNVRQIHLAGFEDKGDYWLDAHNNPVSQNLWKLYERIIRRFGPIPTLIEWDNDLPTLNKLLAEREIAESCIKHAMPTDKLVDS